uniref:Claudin n=1 Tax=Astyanax mexicanus TaxID=7994 RepID=A0A8B9JGJ8_ASTMX
MANMATEIVAFLLSISGWILISSTLPTDYWKVSSVDGTVITTATFWSNLWKTCVTDSTGVSNCKDFPSMLALDGWLPYYLCICEYVCLCILLQLFKLESDSCLFLSVGVDSCGICSLTTCSLYAHRITSEFFDPLFVAQKFELGAALFIGWAGAVLCILGGFIFCFSMTEGFSISPESPHRDGADQSYSHRQFGRNAYV